MMPTLTAGILASAGATYALGRRLGAAAQPGQIIALTGDLGAGKTTLTQGLAAGLGITARVTSPTFTLVNEYAPGPRGLRLIHIDIYRLGDSPAAAQSEAATFGLEDILAGAVWPDADARGNVVAIEWAERVAALLPADYLEVHLATLLDTPDARSYTLTAHGPQSAALLAALEEQP